MDSVLPCVSVTEDFTPLGFSSEVELSEQPAVLDGITEETVLASHPTDPQEIASSSASSQTYKAHGSVDTYVSQDSELAYSVVTNTGNKSAADSGSAAPQGLQKQGESAQMVAIIPTQVRLKGLHILNHNVFCIMQWSHMSLTSEPARIHHCGWFQLRVPCYDGSCRVQ